MKDAIVSVLLIVALGCIIILLQGCAYGPRQPSAWQQHRLQQRQDFLNRPIAPPVQPLHRTWIIL